MMHIEKQNYLQRFIIYLFFLIFVSSSAAQQNPIVVGTSSIMNSEILHESRRLIVYAPGNLKQKYPLILVFDGESLFETTVAAVKFMNYSSEIPQMPEAVIVGVTNTERDRDMPVPQQYGITNGEKNFMNFIKQELIPWVKKKYPLNGHTVAVGHSQGALFVSYLMAEAPETVSWAIALDGPMNMDQKTNRVKEKLAASINEQNIKSRYASIESVFGWGNEWDNSMTIKGKAMQVKLPSETHESMSFKGVYEGLRFLFKDFAPARKDLSLSLLKEYYKSVSEKYGYPYEIPLRVLTASASRKIIEERKDEILDLVNYAEAKYAPNAKTTQLKTDAQKIVKQPNPIIDSLFALPKPTVEQIDKYRGRWLGQMLVPGGQNSAVDIEILIENGTAKLLSVIPWNPSIKEEAEILLITKEGKLVFGRRNRGGGVFVTTCVINDYGELIGEERLVGFTIPENASIDFKKQMNFILTNPNTLLLKKE
jgi:hypothetical protein